MRCSTKAHLLCMASPAQGHINSMLNLAKVLHSKGFSITFVNTEFVRRRLLKNPESLSSLAGLPDFRFASIPDGVSPSNDSDEHEQDIPNLSLAIKNNCPALFLKLLSAMNDPNSGVPPIKCVISDCFASFTLEAATKLGIPNVFYCPSSECGFMDYYYCKELMEKGIIPLKSEDDLTNGYLDTVIDWIPGMIEVRMRDLTSFIRTACKNKKTNTENYRLGIRAIPCKREEVASSIEEMLRGQKGKEMKKKAMEWKAKAFEAAKPGGGSWINLERLVEEIITKE